MSGKLRRKIRSVFGKRAKATAGGPPREVRRGNRPLTLGDLPPDMAEAVYTGQNARAAEELVRGGRFENAPAQTVHMVIEWLTHLQRKCDAAVRGHERFEEFFPEQAQKIAEEKAKSEASGLVTPDGRPIVSAKP